MPKQKPTLKNPFVLKSIATLPGVGIFRIELDTIDGEQTWEGRPNTLQSHVLNFEGRTEPQNIAAFRFFSYLLSCFPEPPVNDPESFDHQCSVLSAWAEDVKGFDAERLYGIADPIQMWQIIFNTYPVIIQPPQRDLIQPPGVEAEHPDQAQESAQARAESKEESEEAQA